MGSGIRTSQKVETIPMVDLRAQYAAIRKEIRTALDAVLKSQQFILGPQVAGLEEELAGYCGRRFGIGVASGTDALLLALRACGIGAGDEVIVPAFSYIATADAVSLLRARPVFVDIQRETFNLDPAQIEARITSRTRAIIPVHLFGLPAEMNPILKLARQHKLVVIEDNAQAIGATYHGRKTGSLGDVGCLSFFPTKNLGGYGDGGMILTDSEELAQRLRSLRVHGAAMHKYVSEEQGWNSRLDEIQAAILRVKLHHLDNWKAARQAHARRYAGLLSDVSGVTVPHVPEGTEHVYHQYTVRLVERDRVQSSLAREGIASTVYYPVPLHLQPLYATLGHRRGDLPQAERASNEVLSLPIYPELMPEQILRIVKAVAAAVRS